MHAYLVTGKTQKHRMEWANKLFNKAVIKEIVNITPDGKNVVIESIRQLTHRLSFAPQDPETGRGVVIENAHLLTQEAANAFLKTLEEPPRKTVFILTAPNKDVVLETIFSRTTHIDLGPAIFEMTDNEKQEAEKLFEKLTTAGVGERLQFLDTIENREAAIKFATRQIYVTREKMLLSLASNLSIRLISLLVSTLRDLESNINIKLTLGSLLLNYPPSRPQNNHE